ncbi:Chaperone protein TorD [bacterium HR29]|jgi:TorA maturation chaperone TorD|nr:Chaperone protein TorD [bacterium HR29]
MTAPKLTANEERAAIRAVGYGFLARAFAYPSPEAVRALRQVAGVAGRVCAGTPISALATAADEVREADLRTHYIETFTHTTNPDCPAYETAYLCRDTFQQTHRMAELCGFYRAWGVQAQRSGSRPDEIGTELEFMGLLAAKEWLALHERDPEREAIAAEAQRLFFREHLGRWAPSFARRLVRCAPVGSFYALAGAALQTWLAEDAAHLGADISAAADEVTVDQLASEPRDDIAPPIVALETIEVMDR